MTLNQIRKALKDRRPSAVAKATGIHPQTIARVRDGLTVPNYATYEKLDRYLEGERGE